MYWCSLFHHCCFLLFFGNIGTLDEILLNHLQLKIVKYIQNTLCFTGKSLSEALIFASTNLQYDDRLFIELKIQYMKIPSSNLGRTCCVQKLFLTFRTIFVHNMFSPCSAKRRASDKDLPVNIIRDCFFEKCFKLVVLD